MGDQLSQLQKEFCPPLDSSLFAALTSDYDLADTRAFEDLRSILKTLKQDALLEESSAFDPSGSSGLHQEAAISQTSSDLAQSWHGEAYSASSQTESTDATELSQALARTGFEHDPSPDLYEGIESLSVEEKSQALKEMFPNAKDFDVSYTLKKAHNDFSKAVEELLNQAFFQDEDTTRGEIMLRKGVDGFSENNNKYKKRKGKQKKSSVYGRPSSMDSSLSSAIHNATPPISRWDRAKEDIDFVAQRTNLTNATVSSVYHSSGGTLHSTIAALCDSSEPDANPYLAASSSDTLEALTAELAVDFPRILPAQASALIRLTYPSTASAHELSRALLASSTEGLSAIVPHYAPRAPSPTPESTETVPTAKPPHAALNPEALAHSRSAAFAKARAAYRQSKSDRLMGGAAAYYSAVGRDASASLRKYEAAAADELVDGQSRHGEIDLHGVTVQDAVRIAAERVGRWWENSGMEYAKAGKVQTGTLRLVTGQGRHSEGGKGRLGPAVAKMLVSKGWRIEIGQGVIDVVGRARK